MPALKGADTCKVLHCELPRLGQGRGAQTADAGGLNSDFPAAVALWAGQGEQTRRTLPPAPAAQRLQFVLSVKPPDSCKAVPSPSVLAQGGWQQTAIACSVIYVVNRAQNWSTVPVGATQMLHAGFAAGAGEDTGSLSSFFNITHMQQKCIETLHDFRGETSSSLALNRLLSNLILV